MTLSRVHKLMLIAAAALSVTTVMFFADRALSRKAALSNAATWARQLGAQAEGMALDARQKGESDPVGWAVRYMTQAPEDRVMRVSKFRTEPDQMSEQVGRDATTGELDYVKVIFPEDGLAVRIQVKMPETGFLGTRGTFTSDLMLLICFGLLYACGFLCFKAYFEPRPATTVTVEREPDGIRPAIRAWIKDAKTLLTQLGVSLRETLREAQNLAVSAAKSRAAISSLRDRIHLELRELRRIVSDRKEIRTSAIQAEAYALNLVIEASRLGAKGEPILQASEELHKLIQKLRKMNEQTEELFSTVERRIEPWATDADIAYHAFDDVERSTQSMDGHIRGTTESLIGQAKMIQTLRGAVGADEQTPQHGQSQSQAQQPMDQPPAPLPQLEGPDEFIEEEFSQERPRGKRFTLRRGKKSA